MRKRRFSPRWTRRKPQSAPAMAAQDFTTAMSAMAALRGPIDAFFDAVQVNSENQHRAPQPSQPAQPHPHHLSAAVADLTRIDG